jgi:glycosyltransferase involved in cell wall biosynthesis
VALRVLVDATDVPTDRGALGRYVDGLLGALAATEIELAVACQLADEDRYTRLAAGATIVAGPVGLGHRSEHLAWEQSGLPVVAERVGADVIHMPNYSMPLRPGRPTVVTIHDLAFFTDPERYSPVNAVSLKSATRTAAQQATRLIVPSKATRDDLIRVLDVDAGRIDVDRHGVDHQIFRRPDKDEVSRVTARLGLHGQPYVAFLGSLTPRKNAPALVSGWALAVADLPDPPALVLGGGGGWSQELDEAVARVPSHLRLIRPGYLPFASLPGFLGGALVVAAPSRGEGFGLPVLEAMACGAPVLTTTRASLPEVGGEAVAYTEPDAASIAVALRGLLNDAERRTALAEAGYARALEFTWETSAAAHVASYKRAAERASTQT